MIQSLKEGGDSKHQYNIKKRQLVHQHGPKPTNEPC